MGTKCLTPVENEKAIYIYLDSSKSTKSTQLFGPRPALEHLMLQRRHLMPIVKKFGGKVELIIWDSFLAAFPDPINAIYAAIEIKESYENEDFKKNFESSKISLSGLCISTDKLICEEIGENHVEDGQIVIHGSSLINLISKTLHFYGVEMKEWKCQHQDLHKDKFMSVERAKLDEIKELESKFVLFISPIELNKRSDCVKTLTANKGYRFNFDENIWCFDDKNNALTAAELIFKENSGKIRISINYAEKILFHENLKIISSYGINANCKMTEDIENNRNSIRVLTSVFDISPGPNYSLRTCQISGMEIMFWDTEKLN